MNDANPFRGLGHVVVYMRRRAGARQAMLHNLAALLLKGKAVSVAGVDNIEQFTTDLERVFAHFGRELTDQQKSLLSFIDRPKIGDLGVIAIAVDDLGDLT